MRLTVNGQTLTERMNVEKDPRIDSVTIADLSEQFKLAMQIRDKTTEANEMVITIRELKKQMDDRQKQSETLKIVFDAFRQAADHGGGAVHLVGLGPGSLIHASRPQRIS